jgi:NADH-quinone oxidoreductase subunit K
MKNIPLEFYLLWASQLFIFGLLGTIVMQNNILFALVSIEVMLLASGLILAITSSFFNDGAGQIFVLFILTVAAAESAIGLTLLIKLHQLHSTASYFTLL